MLSWVLDFDWRLPILVVFLVYAHARTHTQTREHTHGTAGNAVVNWKSKTWNSSGFMLSFFMHSVYFHVDFIHVSLLCLIVNGDKMGKIGLLGNWYDRSFRKSHTSLLWLSHDFVLPRYTLVDEMSSYFFQFYQNQC